MPAAAIELLIQKEVTSPFVLPVSQVSSQTLQVLHPDMNIGTAKTLVLPSLSWSLIPLQIWKSGDELTILYRLKAKLSGRLLGPPCKLTFVQDPYASDKRYKLVKKNKSKS